MSPVSRDGVMAPDQARPNTASGQDNPARRARRRSRSAQGAANRESVRLRLADGSTVANTEVGSVGTRKPRIP